MKNYDTQIWVLGDGDVRTLMALDQMNLITWLNQASEGKERNLLILGQRRGMGIPGPGG